MAKKSRTSSQATADLAAVDHGRAGAAGTPPGSAGASSGTAEAATVYDLPVVGRQDAANTEPAPRGDQTELIALPGVATTPGVAVATLQASAGPAAAVSSQRASQRASLGDSDDYESGGATMRTGGPTPPPPRSSDEPSNGPLGVDVAMRWRGDMHSARFFAKPTRVTLGPNGLFPLPPDVMGGRDEHTLVEPDATHQFALRIDNPAMRGHLLIDGEVYDLAEVRDGRQPKLRGPSVPLTASTHAVVLFDDFTFVISRAPVPPPARMSLWSKENWLLLACFLIALVMLLAPLVAGYNSPDFRDRTKLGYVEQLDERLREIEYVDTKIEEEKEEAKKGEEEKKADEGLKAEAPPIEPSREPPKGDNQPKDDLADLKDEERKEKVAAIVKEQLDKETAALGDALADLGAAPGTRLFADMGDEGGVLANPNGAGGIEVFGDPTGATEGLGGRGGRGPGVGDGSETSKGQVAGLGKDAVAGKGVKLGMQEREQKVVRVGGSVGDASGELPKEVIRKYIATKMGAIKACYQKGLQSNPDLSGKVKVAFLIQPNGAVLGARVEDSGLNNSSVEECILNNIKAWKFPQAKGGGTTKVVYPFNFQFR